MESPKDIEKAEVWDMKPRTPWNSGQKEEVTPAGKPEK